MQRVQFAILPVFFLSFLLAMRLPWRTAPLLAAPASTVVPTGTQRAVGATNLAVRLNQPEGSTVLLVDTTADQPDKQACDTATPDDCSLRGALNKANQTSDTAFIINLPAGIYTLALTTANEDSNVGGDLDVTTIQPLWLVGDPAGDTIVQAGPNPNAAVDRVFDFKAGSRVTLQELTIRHGKATDGGGLYNWGLLTLINSTVISNTATDGGGLLNDGQMTVVNSRILSNTATTIAGGLDNFGGLTITDSMISGNRAVNIGGLNNRGTMTMTQTLVSANAVANNGGGITNYGSLTILNSHILSNTAAGNMGGLNNIGELTLRDSTVSGNRAATTGGINNRGVMTITGSLIGANAVGFNNGGIFNNQRLTIISSQILSNTATTIGGLSNFGAVTLIDSTVSGNSAVNSGGISNRGAMTISHSTVSANRATESGGGLSNGGQLSMIGSVVSRNGARVGAGLVNDDRLTLVNSAVVSNTAQEYGGGISNSAALTITNSTISNNRVTGASVATAGGGGIYQAGNGATLSVIYSTLAHNQATQGTRSGLWLKGGAITLHNTILANNGVGEHGVNNLQVEAGTNFISLGHNLANEWNGAPLHLTDLTADSRLAALAANGASAGYSSLIHDLLPDSPAIDGSDDMACPTTDQRGVARPLGAICDIGAVEGLPMADLALQQTSTPTLPLVGTPITYTLTITNHGPRPATMIQLTDTLPLSATLLAASAGCQALPHLVVCQLGDLVSGGTAQVTVTMQSATPGVITNRAWLTSTVVDPMLNNNEAQVQTQVITRPTTAVIVQPPSVTHSRAVTLTFTGGDGGAGIAGFECALDGRAFGSCHSPQRFDDLPDGPHTFHVRAYDHRGYRDLTPVVVNWTVFVAADLILSQTSTPPTVLAGEPVTYTLTMTNDGPSLATNLGLTATLPLSATLLTTSPGCVTTAPVIVCALADLASGATKRITLTAQFTTTGMMTSSAHLASTVADPRLSNNQAQVQTQVITRPETVLTSQPLSVTTNHTATFTFLGVDGGAGVAGFECALDHGAFADCRSPQSYQALPVGVHTFQVRAYDHLSYRDLTPIAASWLVTQVQVPLPPTPLPLTPTPTPPPATPTPPMEVTPEAPNDVTPEEGGVVIAEEQGLTLTFPVGAVDAGVNITITRMSGPPQATSTFAFAGKAFSIVARDHNNQPVTSFSQPFTLVLTYHDSDWQAAGITDESQLNLYFWNGRAWQAILPCVGCTLDTAANRIIVKLDHLTEFALLAPMTPMTPTSLLYLPLVQD